MRVPAEVELVRPLNCMLAGLAVLIGVFIIGESARVPWTSYEFVRAALAFAAAVLIAGAGNAVNDYFDRNIDKVNRPKRPIPSGRVEPSTALNISQAMFALGILLVIPINWECVIIAALNSLILASYAARLKRIGIAGNIAIGYLVGSTFIFGGLVIGELQVASILAAMAVLATVGRELIKDIEDMKGDRANKIVTIPLRYGTRKAAALATAFIAAAIVLAPLPRILYSSIFGSVYLGVATVSIVVFIAAAALILGAQDKATAANASLACKVAMGIGLLAFLVATVA
ncbi:MAG: digeranylgeranylglyceryl phosphate synthase [Hadesarchaea archaeon CG08_land_8_20_14_0_20_51_8]|nr:MAG: digeranylgeranylglyceryl phosphate synthase [Hadesarchaea archaeon CG08_land_8_20_14_0_20_51_8]